MATRRNTGGSSRQRASSTLVPARGSTAWDMCGLTVAVLAIALAVTLLLPSSAPVAEGVGRFLTLSFGRGALLVPVALFLFAGTFFLDGSPLGTRVACGLALAVTAILSLVSLNAAGNAATPELVVATDFVEGAGGYVGGGVAWACLVSVGRGVGNVLLGGVLVGGVVICGFSISDMVTRFRAHARAASQHLDAAREQRSEARRERRERRRASREVAAAAAAAWDEPARAALGVPDDDGATTFLGGRMTSVLTRVDVDDPDEPVPVEPLTRVRHPNIDVDIVRPADDAALAEAETALLSTGARDADAAPARTTLAIPDFLREAGGAREAAEPADQPIAPAAAEAAAAPRAGEPDERPSAPKAPQARRRAAKTRASEAVAAPKASARPPAKARPGEGDEGYELPPFSMLSSNPNSSESASSAAELDETMAKLQATLAEFGLTSRVASYVAGPLVTTFQIEMGEGERVSRITNLEDDIALTLAAESVRIFAPIQGTSLVGIEIPNRSRQNVHLGDVLPSATGGPLEFALGRDAAGRPVTADLAEMPHLLVAGATGSGKSVMINALIMSLLMRTSPKQVRLILVDPKRVEFAGYNGLPHLYVPVVTEPRQAASALAWAVSEMERRLKVFERAGARNIGTYNEMCVSGKLSEMDNPPEPMPLMVIIIDELADLMMVAGKDVEASIVRIAQLARAAGIHLVLATQRPSANVVTGLIKSNIETRIALSVASGTDSRVILDATGAQRLLGHGDMLFRARGTRTRRVLGCYVSDPEIESVVDFIRAQAEPDYHEEILSAVVPGAPGEGGGASVDEDDDPLVWEAARIVVESQLGSTSGLQRRLKVGYARAGRIMDMLESKGVVGPSLGSKPREVLLDEDGLEELRTLEERYREV